MDVDLHRATSGDLETVRAILEEASAWLLSRGLRQWPERFDDKWIVPELESGNTWLALRDGAVVGTITVQWSDELVWGEQPPVAGYVHRLAVRRKAAGTGRTLLEWAEREVVAAGRDLVRLDCWSGNERLRAYYEDAGYEHRGDTTEWTWTVSRYEKRVG